MLLLMKVIGLLILWVILVVSKFSDVIFFELIRFFFIMVFFFFNFIVLSVISLVCIFMVICLVNVWYLLVIFINFWV